MTRASGSIEIDASPHVVWQWIVEPDKYLVWNTDFSDYEILEHNEGGVGTRLRMVGFKGRSQITLDCVVTHWSENERFSFRGSSDQNTKVEGTFRLQASGGGCTVTFDEHLELPGVVARS